MNTLKKILALLCFCALLLTSLTSCAQYFWDWVYGTGPWNRPMSKWTADGVELYILNDCGPTDVNPSAFVNDAFMIVHYGDTEIVYKVGIYSAHTKKGYVMYISDGRETIMYTSSYSKNPPHIYTLSAGNIETISETEFSVTLIRPPEISGGGYDIPELMLPEEITFTLAAENLTEADIPEIHRDEQYQFCPTYRTYSEWISDDLKLFLYVSVYSDTDKRVRCRFNDGSGVSFYVNFFESNSSAFLTKITEENQNVNDVSLIVNASGEQWECEFFEDYFVATVIRSEYYEVGQILTFNLLLPPTHPEAEQHWEDDKTPIKPTIIVPGAEIFDDYAVLPLCKLLDSMGFDLEWIGNDRATFALYGTSYEIVISEGTLTKAGDEENYLICAPGNNHFVCYESSGDLMVDDNTIQCLFQSFLEYSARVYVDRTNNCVMIIE